MLRLICLRARLLLHIDQNYAEAARSRAASAVAASCTVPAIRASHVDCPAKPAPSPPSATASAAPTAAAGSRRFPCAFLASACTSPRSWSSSAPASQRRYGMLPCVGSTRLACRLRRSRNGGKPNFSPRRSGCSAARPSCRRRTPRNVRPAASNTSL